MAFAGLVRLLGEIEGLLRKHGHTAQADTVADLIDLSKTDVSRFIDGLGGGELWGSAGAVWEVADLPGAEDQRFQNLLIELVDEMGRLDINFPSAQFVASTLRKWREKGT